ncbi:MAG: penicillin-binding protein 2 [Sphingomonadales bacterium]
MNVQTSAAMEIVRNRLMVAVFLFLGIFVLLSARMVALGISGGERVEDGLGAIPFYEAARADILDVNGTVLATNLEIYSLYADPTRVLNALEAISKLSLVFPDLNEPQLLARLTSGKRFVWIKRKLTPNQKWQVNALGIPGFFFQTEEERVYPQGSLFSHVIGFVDVDGKGLGGVERYFNSTLTDEVGRDEGLRLTLDTRIQHALRDEMAKAVEKFQAKGSAGVIMDIKTGAVLAMVSLPDFDPNHPGDALPDQKFNRASQGVYELGSIFKILTVATALETGAVTLKDGYDATYPLRIASFTIRDDHPQKRYLTVPEIFIFSSNIGAAQMALDIGKENQQDFFRKLGLLQRPYFELSEVGQPLYPTYWREINTMTAAYGHGIAISPLQMASAIAATVNGGHLIPATLSADNPVFYDAGEQVFSAEVSEKMRALMRLTVTEGTGKQANVPGYLVGGKTGTAEKAGVGAYQEHALMSSFVGVFPMDAPKYLVLIVVDEPIGTKDTYNFAGGGWVAAPSVGRVIARIAPLLGVKPISQEVNGYQDVAFLIDKEAAR